MRVSFTRERRRSGIGHRRRAVLGARGHHPDSTFAGNRVEDGNIVDADDAKGGVDTSGLEAIENELATRASPRLRLAGPAMRRGSR